MSHLRGSQYLRGFFEWKRGNLEAAARAYQAAEKVGDHSVGVYRDRAYCLFRLGRLKDAENAIKVALDRYPRNNYVVDLATEIAISRGNFKEAEALMQDLKDTDVMENFYHRSATLKAAQKQFHSALVDAELAILRNPPLHEILAQYIDILIELARFGDAEKKLDEVSQQFKGRNAQDAQLGLRCKMCLRQGNWRDAAAYYHQLNSKDLPVHLGLLHEILRQKLKDASISENERRTAAEDMAKLEAKEERPG
jgi:tetratricopeptide (TPR) repeat protein